MEHWLLTINEYKMIQNIRRNLCMQLIPGLIVHPPNVKAPGVGARGHKDSQRWRDTENGSRKNVQESWWQHDCPVLYCIPELGENCYVSLLKLYYSKLPPKLLHDPESVLYWKLKDKVPMFAGAPWFVLTLNPCTYGEEHVSSNWSEKGPHTWSSHLNRCGFTCRLS